jgi:hypothetical protein
LLKRAQCKEALTLGDTLIELLVTPRYPVPTI